MRIFSLTKKAARTWFGLARIRNWRAFGLPRTAAGVFRGLWETVLRECSRMTLKAQRTHFLRLKNRGRVTVSGVRAYPVDISANTGIRLCVCGALNQVFGMPCVATGRCLGEMGECRGSLRSTKQAGLYLPKDIPPWIQIRWRSPAKSGVGLSM